jgi:replicative DNA helicase
MSAAEKREALAWSEAAERGLLGALLLDLESLDVIASKRLDAGCFFDRRNRAVWVAANALAAKRQPIEVVGLFEQLRDTGQAAAFGSDTECLQYVNDLQHEVLSAANVERHADIVAEKAMRRQLMATVDKAQALALEPGDSDEVMDKLAALFTSLKRRNAGAGPQALGALAVQRLAHWQAMAEGDTAPGVPTGFASLDQALGGGLKPGKTIVLAARPGVGKTSLAAQIGLFAAGQGAPVLNFSQEMPAGELVDRAVSNLGNVHLDSMTTGRFSADDWLAVVDATEATKRLPYYVDDAPAQSLLDMRAKARLVQQRHGLAVVIVDYLQLCSSTLSPERRHHQIEQISRGMKQLAKELGVCVLLLSQLKRVLGDPEPELEHLKESGAIEEDADTVVLLHPMAQGPTGERLTLAKVAKNRQGRRGRLAFWFAGKTQRWTTADSALVVTKKGGAE